MLRSLILLCAFSSNAAFACPDLAGSYSCRYPNSDEDLSITQRVENGVTYYSFDGVEFGVDGREFPYWDFHILNGTVTATCAQSESGETLNLKYKGEYYVNKKRRAFMGHADMTAEIRFQSDLLTILRTGTRTHVLGFPQPVHEYLKCTRK